MASRTLPLDNREPNPEAAVLSPEMAQYHLDLARAQRDHNNISDKEMAKMEGAAGMLATRSRTLWNPFTGQFRTVELSNRYKSGDYLTITPAELSRLITGE